ncbi:sigma factor-like helix-turn-helix DNA-binding protein [Pseudomonas mangiferae]|uniref:RNA polymerase sigma factor 70 region 4 type 2 domain-containing protein n=1 Tax=Pseudomonas mangiferae TaxID=2593654 RepID=A0A553GXM1_9PSED|nr:sigma factor-like helix-turn-helix DNA-binding protein [Pseudomonas mangiferae]TRX74226.1 hypothetical protein FM069_13910 [Pseudomonas mangiferae]
MTSKTPSLQFFTVSPSLPLPRSAPRADEAPTPLDPPGRAWLRALRGLPRRVQRVFLLSRLDGLAYGAIAQQLGVPLLTVERDLIRALQHCQRYAREHR